jgi:hypothetical protein
MLATRCRGSVWHICGRYVGGTCVEGICAVQMWAICVCCMNVVYMMEA